MRVVVNVKWKDIVWPNRDTDKSLPRYGDPTVALLYLPPGEALGLFILLGLPPAGRKQAITVLNYIIHWRAFT